MNDAKDKMSGWEGLKQELRATRYGWLFLAGYLLILLSPWADTRGAAVVWLGWLFFCGWLAK